MTTAIPVPTASGAPPTVNVTVVPTFPPAVVNIPAARPDHLTALTTLGAGVIGVFGTLLVQWLKRRGDREDSTAQARLQAELLTENAERQTRLQAELAHRADLFRASRDAAKAILAVVSDLEEARLNSIRNSAFDSDFLIRQRRACNVLETELPSDSQRALGRSFDMLSWADEAVRWSSETSISALTDVVLTELRSLLAAVVRDEGWVPSERWTRASADLEEYHEMLGREYEEQTAFERQERERRSAEMAALEAASGNPEAVGPT